MSVRRHLVCLLAAAGIVAVVVPAPAKEPAGLVMAGACDNITADQIDRLLKGLKAENAARAGAVAEANAKKADADAQKTAADAAGREAATVMVGDMAKTGECKDNFSEKDKRSKEIQRLYDLASAASDSGDDKKSEAYSEQASTLEQALEIDADRACGGKGASFLADCRADLARKNPSLSESEIAMQCVVKMTERQVGAEGMAAHAAGNAASQADSEAQRMMSEAKQSGSKEGAEAAGVTERDYGRLKDCVIDRLNRKAPMPDESAAAIDKRASELKQALNP